MKSLIKNIVQSSVVINLRNNFNLRPVSLDINHLKLASVSDAFVWRTDNGFVTKFKYSDILNIFYKIPDSSVELHFYTKENKLIKKIKYTELSFSNEIEINSELLDGIEDYGTFYIFHFSNRKIDKENIISNRCYLGYSKNKNLPSFVHGNVHAKYAMINGSQKIDTDIVKTSLFKNQKYRIQKYFTNFDKSELLFVNPTSKLIKFSVNHSEHFLKAGSSILIDISCEKCINIKSNCLFFRPTIFNYKGEYLDVHHS
tara:strand:- start:276 stop:1046 length:771 start_codon:yes stop_codon:yes gene_type:complete